MALWLARRRARDVHDASSALTAAGACRGLLGAYLVLVELLLLARLPVLDRLVGFDRLTRLAPLATAASRSRCCSPTPC